VADLFTGVFAVVWAANDNVEANRRAAACLVFIVLAMAGL